MLRIEKIEGFGIAVPLETPIKMSNVRIASCDNLIVRISDTDGRIGWGEASSSPSMTGETTEGMVAAIHFMGPQLEGREIEDASHLHDMIEPLMYGNHAAKSAIDMALLDLIGQRAGRPLYDLLGGARRERAPMLWMVAGTQDEIQLARRKFDDGYVVFKVKVGANDPETDLGRARATRGAMGPDLQISADANQGYSRADAIAFAAGAGEAGLDFFEQPVMGHDLEGMVACAKAASIPIGADEGLHSIADIQRHHELGAAAGGSLKLIKLGGAAMVMEAGRLMECLGMHVNLAGKVADTSVGSAAIAHLALALPTLDWAASVTNQYLADDVVENPIKVVDGHLAAPDAPGLGVRVDEARMARYRTIG